jgi:hypothetical protein
MLASEIESSLVPQVAGPHTMTDNEEDGDDRTARGERPSERRATLLNRRTLMSADIMRLVKAKDIRVTGTRHNHNLQQRGLEADGVYELSEELDGYLSSGGQSLTCWCGTRCHCAELSCLHMIG